MADAFFTEQHELVRKLAREFAETELTKEVLDKVEEEEVFPEEILDKMAKAGFFGIKVPKQYGLCFLPELPFRRSVPSFWKR